MYFYRKQIAPYHPAEHDWTTPGDLNLLDVPNFADMTMESQDPALECDRDQCPLYRTMGGTYMVERSLAFDDICLGCGIDTYLCFYILPWEFCRMKAQYNFGEATVIPEDFITHNCGEVALHEFETMLTGLKGAGVEFVMAQDLPGMVNVGLGM